MRNTITYCPSPLTGIERYSRSAFMVEDDEENNLAPFSWSDLNIFKNKDTSEADINKSSSTDKNSGSGIGNGILTGVLGIAGLAGALAPVLPQLGIGSKSRIAETNAIANANTQVYNAQSQLLIAEQNKEKDKEKLYLIIGVGLLLIIIVAGVLFARK